MIQNIGSMLKILSFLLSLSDSLLFQQVAPQQPPPQLAPYHPPPALPPPCYPPQHINPSEDPLAAFEVTFHSQKEFKIWCAGCNGKARPGESITRPRHSFPTKSLQSSKVSLKGKVDPRPSLMKSSCSPSLMMLTGIESTGNFLHEDVPLECGDPLLVDPALPGTYYGFLLKNFI